MSAVYRSADIRMWGDERVLNLSVAAERVWTWLLIGPFTTAVPGLVLTPRAGMAERMRMSLRTFDRAMKELIGKEMVEADWKSGVIILPKAPEQEVNSCQSTSTAVAWAKVFSQFAPQCELTRRHRAAIAAALVNAGEGMAQAFETESRGHYRKAVAKPESERGHGDDKATVRSCSDDDSAPAMPLHSRGDSIAEKPNDSVSGAVSPNHSPNGSPNASPEQDPGTGNRGGETHARVALAPTERVSRGQFYAAWTGAGLGAMQDHACMEQVRVEFNREGCTADPAAMCAAWKRLTSAWRKRGLSAGDGPLLMLRHLDKCALVVTGELDPDADRRTPNSAMRAPPRVVREPMPAQAKTEDLTEELMRL